MSKQIDLKEPSMFINASNAATLDISNKIVHDTSVITVERWVQDTGPKTALLPLIAITMEDNTIWMDTTMGI